MSQTPVQKHINSPRSQELYRRAKQLIPGGTQLLSKRPEMFAPDQWPPYYRSARGSEIVDLDGNTYLDMSITGIGACLLGYADPDVTDAVVRRVQNGSMCTLNPPEEVELEDPEPPVEEVDEELEELPVEAVHAACAVVAAVCAFFLSVA